MCRGLGVIDPGDNGDRDSPRTSLDSGLSGWADRDWAGSGKLLKKPTYSSYSVTSVISVNPGPKPN